MNKLKILSFNILAESWFINHLYNTEIIPELNKYFPINKRNHNSDRIKTVKSYLNNLINNNLYDIICLQETENYFNEYLFQKYLNEYQIYSVYHDDSFWQKDISKDIPFYSNGVTMMINKNKFMKIDFYDIKIDIGNHAIFAKCIDNNNTKFNIINTHLDIEDETNIIEYLYYNKLGRGRYKELSNIIKILNKNESDINLVIGDLNDGLNGFATKKFLTNNDFIDLFAISNNLSNTYPYYSNDNYNKFEAYRVIDKIFLQRGLF